MGEQFSSENLQYPEELERLCRSDNKIRLSSRPAFLRRASLEMILVQPLQVTETRDQFDIHISARGGGLRGQAGAASLGIARALVNDPSIILADEPTGALDTRTGEEIMELFIDLHRAGNTIFLVTLEEHIARHSCRIVRFRDWLIESDRPIEEEVAV